jgi:hypothetical protein
MAIIVGLLSLFYIALVGFFAGVLLITYGDAVDSIYTAIYANSLGLFSSIVATIQFMPQLIKTFRSRVLLRYKCNFLFRKLALCLFQ